MSDRFFSFVLQQDPCNINFASLVSRIRELVAPLGISVSLVKDEGDGTATILDIGGVKICVISKAASVPEGTLTQAVRNSIGWPEAGAAVAGHTQHVIVGCLDQPQDHQQALHFAAMTTFVTATVLQEADGTGVYWATGEIMISAQGWQRAATSILSKNLPVEDWIGLYFSRGGDGEIGAVTEGARAFFGMEIEFVPARLEPADLAGRLFGLVRYLLLHGAVLKDGDTLGQNAEEIVRIRFKERGAQFQGRVLQLTLERDGNQKHSETEYVKGTTSRINASPGSKRAGRRPFGRRGQV